MDSFLITTVCYVALAPKGRLVASGANPTYSSQHEINKIHKIRFNYSLSMSLRWPYSGTMWVQLEQHKDG